MGKPANLQIKVTSDSQQAQNDIAQAESKITGTLNKLKTAGPAAAAAAAAAIGLALAAGISKALDQSKIQGRLAAQLGGTAADAERAGKLAGTLFSKAITSDFQTAADTVSAVMRSGIAPPDATLKQLESLATKASDLSGTFDQETSQITRAVSTMLRTGIAKNADQAFDVLTRGFQNGTNAADDLLDVFSEYSTQFRDIGLTADQAMGILKQGLQGGARDADIVADALKELNIRIKDQSAADALKTLRLNAEDMAVAFTKGGPEAAAGLDLIFDRLREVKDPAERTALAVKLLGTQAEDLAGALLTIDPSSAVEALGQVTGASDAVGTSLRDNAGHNLDVFKNSLQQKLVDFLGGTVVPALQGFWEWLQNKVAPALRDVGGAATHDASPALKSLSENVDGLSGTVQNNTEKWGPLYDMLKSKAPQAASGLALIMSNNLVRGLDIVISFVTDLVDGLRQLINWIQSAIGYLDRLARRAQNFFGGIGETLGFGSFSAMSLQSDQTVMHALAAGPAAFAQAPSQTLMRETFYRPMNLSVTIDGQQLQGRINRTVSSALQYDGARYTAGGWA